MNSDSARATSFALRTCVTWTFILAKRSCAIIEYASWSCCANGTKAMLPRPVSMRRISASAWSRNP